MASVNKILLPRRAKASVMRSESKKNTILEKGEMFIEYPDSGIGTGHVKIKFGDGTTPYGSTTDYPDGLPYALGDTSNDNIDFVDRSTTDIDEVIGRISTGSPLGELIAFIKRAVGLLKAKDDTIDTTISNITAGNQIKNVVIVDRLPDNPDSNTLYLIRA